ncbi:MAG TPA: hypothetical protein VG755_23960 [Nannocystaceae bacterium]|nr:hypothetical protein [Nannocystaceae bacterium]
MLRGALAIVPLVLGGCWNGEEALHKPCQIDDHCGKGVSCEQGFCGGPPACIVPQAPRCDPGQRTMSRDVTSWEIRQSGVDSAVGAVGGDFIGNADDDIGVLGGYEFYVLENAGGDTSWPPVNNQLAGQVKVDLLAADFDGDGQSEFVMLDDDGVVRVLDWDESSMSPVAELPLGDALVQNLTTIETPDFDGPVLLGAGASGLHLIPNVDGVLAIDDAMTFETPDAMLPNDTLAVCASGPLVLVPDSDENTMMGERNQAVFMYTLEGRLQGTLADDFENPWAFAQGDFLGGDEIEIAVAERRVNMTSHATDNTGRVRFFRIAASEAEEVGDAIDIGIGPNALTAADLDCDGKDELVIGYSGLPDSGLGMGAPAHVLFGTTAAKHGAADLVAVPVAAAGPIVAGNNFGVGDFDVDGRLEVAIPDVADREGDVGGVMIVDIGGPG